MFFTVTYCKTIVAQFTCGRKMGLTIVDKLIEHMEQEGQMGTMEVKMAEDNNERYKVKDVKTAWEIIKIAKRIIQLTNNANRAKRAFPLTLYHHQNWSK